MLVLMGLRGLRTSSNSNRLKIHSLLAIYPTAHKVEDLLKRQSKTSGSFLGHRLMTFPQLIDALWRESGAVRVIIGPGAERMVLEAAISRVRAHGVQLPFDAGPGLRDHLLRFIRQLKSAAIEPEDLRQACASLSHMAAGRMSAAAEIFAEYEITLRESGAADAHDRAGLVIEWLHRMEQEERRPLFLKGVERLLVAEIYDPGLLQFMLVSSLTRMIGDATLTIQAEPFELRVSRFAELTWNRFVAEESISDKVLPHFVRRGGRSGRLGYVLNHLFEQAEPLPIARGQLSFSFARAADSRDEPASTQGKMPPPDSTVRIIEAPNPRREAEEVARLIRRMLELPASEQISLDRVAIVARNLASYGEHLETAFEAYRIPLSLFRRQSLSASPVARVICELLRIPLYDYHRDRLVTLCRAPFLRFAAARFQDVPARVGYIDRNARSLSACIDTRRAELVRLREQTTDNVEADRLRSQLSHFENAALAWDGLFESLATLETPSTIEEYVSRTVRILDKLGFDPVRDSLNDSSAAAAGPLRLAFETLANEAKIVAPGHQVRLAEFAAIVEQTLEETTFETVSNHFSGGVRAMAVADARGLDFELVFIIGLNDGIFPNYSSEDPLVPDDTIRKLNAPLRDALRRRMGKYAPDAPGPILRTHRDRNMEEPFLFFLAMSMPARSVVLSYSAADIFGKPLQVSPFLREVHRILNDTLAEKIGTSDLIPQPDECFASGEFLARAALNSVLNEAGALYLADTDQIQSILRRTEVERRREKYFALPCREELVDDRLHQDGWTHTEWLAVDLSPDAEKLGSASPYDGRVTPTHALGRFLLEGASGGLRKWSAGQLSELAACGYKYFARRILQLRESEEADYEQTPLEMGSNVHQILRAIFTDVNASDPVSLRASARQVLENAHRQQCLAARDPSFFEVEWASVEAMVNEIIDYEIRRLAGGETAAQTYHEFPLEFALSLEPGIGGIKAPEVALIGQIDRLELYRDGHDIKRLKVIDYKTSRRLTDYADRIKPDHFGCEDLQMPVYALGAAARFRSELSAQGTVEVSYIALKTRDKETEPQSIPLAVLEASGQKTVAARIRDLIAAAVAGRFEVDPLECSEYCPYRRVCRYRRQSADSRTS